MTAPLGSAVVPDVYRICAIPSSFATSMGLSPFRSSSAADRMSSAASSPPPWNRPWTRIADAPGAAPDARRERRIADHGRCTRLAYDVAQLVRPQREVHRNVDDAG